MDWVFDQPAVVLVFVTVAAIAMLIEIALPTLGVAGTVAGGSVLVALAGLIRQDAEWWPLAGCAVAAVVWVLLIAGRRRHTGVEFAAAGLFAVSGVGFAIANEDWPSAVVALAAAALMAVLFPWAHRSALRIVNAPAQTGMEALHGRVAIVETWTGTTGVVMLDGSRWNAFTPDPATGVPGYAAGSPVQVCGHRGNALEVGPGPGFVPGRPAHRYGPPPGGGAPPSPPAP